MEELASRIRGWQRETSDDLGLPDPLFP